jgi:hypothetical protein
VAQIRSIGVSVFGVSSSRETLVVWIRDPRSPEINVAAWGPGDLVEDRWPHIGDRHLGTRRFKT